MSLFYVIFKNGQDGEGQATIIKVWGLTVSSVKLAFPTAYDVLAV